MYVLKTRDKLVTALGLILLAGFLGVNFANYLVSSDALRRTLVNNELPLTSNNIYSEIQAGLLRPVHISSMMANDTFLKDWLLDGERDLSRVTNYLREIKHKYGVFSTFVVSARSGRYYHFDGVLKRVSPEALKDRWFFTMRDHPGDYRVDLDTNEAASDRLTIFVNHKMHDYSGQFIGVTGLGLDALEVAKLIEHYKLRFDRDIYFVDPDGLIKSHSNGRIIDRVNIRQQPGIGDIAAQILANDQGTLRYTGEPGTVHLQYRYIPELGWYLLVEQAENAALADLRQSFYLSIALSLSVTLLVLLLSGYTVQYFQHRLEQMARIDELTGLYNRQFFDSLFDNALNVAARHNEPLSLLLFDIDHFKQINDAHGHLAGDRALREVAEVAKSIVPQRRTDLLGRWGGDEFAVVLGDCDAVAACRMAERLSEAVKARVRPAPGAAPVTLSIGVAEYAAGEDRQRLMERADSALYRAKHGGRDRVASSPSERHEPPPPATASLS